MIKVKILSPIYVDGFAYRKNVEYQINDEVANILLQKGYCELIKEEQENPVEQELPLEEPIATLDLNPKEVDYNELTVAELKELLEQRGLSTSGKKADLIKRLQEN